MGRWQPVPIVGGAYSDATTPWSHQDTVNWIPVRAERPGGRSESMLRSAPGLVELRTLAAGQPIRCLHNADGLLFAVAGTTAYSVTPSGATSLGTIPGVTRVTAAHNQITGGNQVVFANGQSGYVYDTTTETLAQITDEGFPGFKNCDFVDGYIIGVEPGGRFWFHSQLNDATEYNTLDRYEAESAPDKIVRAIVSHREVIVLGERTTEVFQNTGAATGTFARMNGTEMEVGCGAEHSVVRLDNTIFWLGSDGSVYRLQGYTPTRISTHALEQAISQQDMASALAYTYEDRGHKIYYLTFPSGQTFGYDVASGEWHRRRSQGLNRWRVNALVRWDSQWIAGDFSNGKLFTVDWDVMTEDGEEIERRRISPVLHDSQNRITVHGAELVFATGEPGIPVDHSSDHAATMRYSKDGGKNWSSWKSRSIGVVGEFTKRVRFLRLGRGRQWLFDIRVTSPMRADLMAASMQASGDS